MSKSSGDRRGAPIPGSRYVRDFCAGCGEPIRVSPENLTSARGERIPNFCEVCTNRRPLPPVRDPAVPEEPSPSWENAVRVLEDART